MIPTIQMNQTALEIWVTLVAVIWAGVLLRLKRKDSDDE